MPGSLRSAAPSAVIVEPMPSCGIGLPVNCMEMKIGRNHVGDDQHAVLGHLGVGDPLHAAEGGVEKDQRHADDNAHVDAERP